MQRNFDGLTDEELTVVGSGVDIDRKLGMCGCGYCNGLVH